MTKVAYTVTASFPDAPLAEAFIAWLKGGHIAAVLAGGAESAQVVRVDCDAGGGADSSRARIEVRYTFATREQLRTYLQVHAPALRAEGMRLFGPERGVVFTRSTGEFI